MEHTNEYPFTAILANLSSGREIEFSYQGKEYSITNDCQGNWNFCCDTDGKWVQYICPFEDKDALITFVGMKKIEGTLLSEIFDKMLYEDSSLYIL